MTETQESTATTVRTPEPVTVAFSTRNIQKTSGGDSRRAGLFSYDHDFRRLVQIFRSIPVLLQAVRCDLLEILKLLLQFRLVSAFVFILVDIPFQHTLGRLLDIPDAGQALYRAHIVAHGA